MRPVPALHTLPPAEFWTRVRSFGGFPDELADQPDYREIFEPALRADYTALAGFRYRDGPPLDVPIVAVVGRADSGMPASDARAWSAQTAAGFRLETVDGDHWLLNKSLGDLLRIVERLLGSTHDREPIASPRGRCRDVRRPGERGVVR
jgi:surfactin synthase thioesterase subunit